MIQDLSYPQNEPHLQSVNAGINSNNFHTEWGTFNIAAATILTLPQGCVAAMFNITAAYWLTLTHPEQQHSLCVFWKDKVYVDRAVMFGLSSSAGVFGSIADMLIAIYRAAGFGIVIKWVDDFLAIRLPGQSWLENDFITLTGSIRVPWSTEKTRLFSIIQRYISFNWDLNQRSISLPDGKLIAIKVLLDSWLTPHSKYSARCALSLHGKLVHISCIFPLIRPFLRSLSHFAGNFNSPIAKLHPPHPVVADLEWIHQILYNVPNTIPLSSPEPIDINWWGDASTSFGVGLAIGDRKSVV